MSYQTVFEEFFEQVKLSIKEGTFAKLTMAKTIGDTDLKNIFVRLHLLENNEYDFAFTFRYKTEEVEQFHSVEQTFLILSSYIKNPFTNALLFTIEKDLIFKVNKKNAASLTEQTPTFKHASDVMLEMIEKKII
ncbi:MULTISPECIES: hypothetical protein [Empedobacter]|uniref:Uncharacterized protein n=1 Tax=Empedobacter falsenii TaxID=343874 RepID=A0A427BKI1_9FLAO|nr:MULTISPECIES: hypothetical protein [Empedobacter]MBY0066632.1 hypothetical protein [Empedobacter falsenii]MDH0659622.1 hypothetical protein [Empedobacter sp. GD03865]RRT89805.1 hypothetical protein EGI88_10710 [Empedobacter falsenii]RRT89874.1 hypothetical protein EGI89_10895 [Empedobacter falsenii]